MPNGLPGFTLRRARPTRARGITLVAVLLAIVAVLVQTLQPAQAAPSPLLLHAFADDGSAGGAGIQAGDRVVLTFDSSTNALPITAGNVDIALALNNGHTWLDGAGAIGGAVWSQTTVPNDTLTITLSTGTSAPTVGVADTITIGAATIQDPTGTNDASGNGKSVAGSFDRDAIVFTGLSAAPAFATVGTTGVVMERLTLTTVTNDVTMTQVVLTRTGTAVDADTSANGVKVYHDINNDGLVDGGDALLGSGTFAAGSATIAASLGVTAAAPQAVLLVLDIAPGATPTNTIGVSLASAASITVSAPDAVRDLNFPHTSTLTTVAAPPPNIVSATANANGAGGSGVQAGDQVVVVFDSTTNAPALTGANVDAALPLNNGHQWRDGAGAIASAVWSQTTVPNDTLTVTFTAGGSPPSIATGDTISLGTVIKDVSGGNNATNTTAVAGSFGVDTLTTVATDRAPATATLGSTGTTLVQLTLTADFNQIVVTSLRVDRTGTAGDGDTVASGVKIYDDIDNDGVRDAGEPLLGSGTFAGGSVTIPIAKSVAAGTPENVLVAVDTNAAGTPGRTIGVTMAASTYLGVSAGDVVNAASFPLSSGSTLLAAPAPALLSAVAVDNNGGLPGIQAGDEVVITMDRSTNAFAITAGNIDATLILNNGHTWLDGAGAIGGAVWSQTTVPNDTLTITFSAAVGAPTVAVGDTITIAAGTVQDETSTNNASGSPPTISGQFGDDLLTVTAIDLAPANVATGQTDIPMLRLTMTALANSVVVTAIDVDRTGVGGDGDVSTGGVKLWYDANGSGTLDIADQLIGTGAFAGGTVRFTTSIGVTQGAPEDYFVSLNISTGATLLNTIGVSLGAATYVQVSAGDRVDTASFPLVSTTPTIVAPSPRLSGFVALDTSTNGEGIQAGDQAILTFDSATNALPITNTNIDTVFALNNSHTWLDGAGAIISAVWSTSTFINDTLTVTLSATSGVPTIAPGDTITIPPGTIRDTTGTNDAIGSPPTLSGSFGADVLTVTGTSLVASVVNEHTTGVVWERLDLTAVTNTVVVTGMRIDRLGTANDTSTTSGGVKVYHDLDSDDIVDATDTLLASGTFITGTLTLTTPVTVPVGTTQRLLIVLDLNVGAGTTIGVGLLNSSYILVATGDAVANTNFGILSNIATIAAEQPDLTAAVASDDSAGGEGTHTGDTVTLVFNAPTNAFAINATNINTTLVLDNSHSWLDGAGALASAVWSTSTFTNDTLTITLTAGTSAPTVAVGDTITIPSGTIMDITNTNDAIGSPPSITGTFGRDLVTITAVDVAPSTFSTADGDVPLLRIAAAVGTNSATLTSLTVKLTGTMQTTDLHKNGGLLVYADENQNGAIDAGDITLASIKVTATSVVVPLTFTVNAGAGRSLLLAVRPAPGAVVGRTVGVTVDAATALSWSGPDTSDTAAFPLTSGVPTLVGAAPTMIAALAVDTSGEGGGIQTGDQVVILFSRATNAHPITAETINATLTLTDGHSWLSGTGVLAKAEWSTGVETNDTLTITLSDVGGSPTIAVDDAITIAAGTIADPSGQIDATATARILTGTFGPDGPEAPPGTPVTLVSGVAAAEADSTFTSVSARHALTVPAAAAPGDLIVKLETYVAGTPSLPVGAALGDSPLAVSLTFAATNTEPTTLPAPIDLTVTPSAADLGSTPATGLIAYQLTDADAATPTWTLLPTWVDEETGTVHIAVRRGGVIAVAAVTPRVSTLTPGWNLVTYTGAANTPVAYLFRNQSDKIDAIHRWDGVNGGFLSAFPFAPSFSTLTLVQPQDALWVHVRGEATVEWARYGGPLSGVRVTLHPGWNLAPWAGPETTFTAGAAGLFGRASAVYRWDAESGTYQIFLAGGAALFNTLTTLHPLDGLWIYVTTERSFEWEQPGLPPETAGA